MQAQGKELGYAESLRIYSAFYFQLRFPFHFEQSNFTHFLYIVEAEFYLDMSIMRTQKKQEVFFPLEEMHSKF